MHRNAIFIIKTSCCYDNKSDKFKFSSKGLNKRVLEDSGDGPMSKHRRVLARVINLSSKNTDIRTVNHIVAAYVAKKERI